MNQTMEEKWIRIADRIIEYCIYGVVFFFPISIALVEIILSLAVMFFLIKKILQPDFKSFKNLSCFFLSLFFIFSALSIINSGPYLKKSLITLIFKWTEYILFFLIVKDTLNSPKRVRNAIFILLIFAVIVGIDGLVQKVFGFEFIRNRSLGLTDNKLVSITGPFRHFNDFGVYLLVVLSLIIGLLLKDKLKLRFKVLLCLLYSPLAACLLLTFSRGSWVGLIFVLLSLILLTRKFMLPIIALSLFIFLLTYLPGVKEKNFFIVQYENNIEHSEIPPSGRSIIWRDSDRFRVWKTAFRMIRENPFLGKGIGTFMDYFAKYETLLIVQYAHNCFLQIWAETGIFSLLSFLLFVGSVLVQSVKKFKKNNDFLLIGLVCGMIGFLVHSFFDTHLYSLQISILFWLMMGIIAAKTSIDLQS